MAAPIDLRNDFDSDREEDQGRDPEPSSVALAEVYDGGSRTDARGSAASVSDHSRLGAALQRPGLVDGKSPGAPSKLNAEGRPGPGGRRRRALAARPGAVALGDVRPRRELLQISARPRHYAQNELAVEAKKNFPAELAKIRARLPKGVEIELWWRSPHRPEDKLTRRCGRRLRCPAKGKGRRSTAQPAVLARPVPWAGARKSWKRVTPA